MENATANTNANNFSLEITPTIVGILGVNCYLLRDTVSGEAVLVDPGDRPEKIFATLDAKNVSALKAIWITHVHFDHIGAAEAIADHYACPIYVSQVDLEGARKAPAYGKLMRESYESFERALVGRVQYVDYDVEINLGAMKWRAIPVPGHSAESVCFYQKDEGVLMAGDTIFLGVIGREDLYINELGGKAGTLLKNIREKLLILPDETKVYPGHGLATTIGNERRLWDR